MLLVLPKFLILMPILSEVYYANDIKFRADFCCLCELNFADISDIISIMDFI